MYANILIPTDGSECADKAVEHGVIFAKQLGAKVTAVTVTEPFRYAMRQFRYSPTEYTKHAEKHTAVPTKILRISFRIGPLFRAPLSNG